MRPRGSNPLALGVLGVLAMTFAVVVVVAGLVGGEETQAPAGPETGPVATRSAEPAPDGKDRDHAADLRAPAEAEPRLAG